MMKLWNLHVMKHGYVDHLCSRCSESSPLSVVTQCIVTTSLVSRSFIADNQMNQAIMFFVENCGAHITRRNLCRNFLLHLVSMHDFNLVNTSTIDRAMSLLRKIQEELKDTKGEEKQSITATGTCNGTSSGGKQGKRTKSSLTD